MRVHWKLRDYRDTVIRHQSIDRLRCSVQESDHDSESDREGAADEGVEGWMEKREDEGRRRARNGEAEVRSILLLNGAAGNN